MSDRASGQGKKRRKGRRRSRHISTVLSGSAITEIQGKAILPLPKVVGIPDASIKTCNNPPQRKEEQVNQQKAKNKRKNKNKKAKNKKKRSKGDDVTGGKREDANDGQDTTINIFPDDILIHILSFLDSTKESCRTTILSKRWKNLWTQLPRQVFYISDWNNTYNQFLLRYLDLAPINIINLSLRCLYIPTPSNPAVDLCFRHALKHQVEHLTLESLSDREYLLLPESIYSQGYMTSLRMRGYSLPPQGTSSWGSLMVLEVSYTEFNGICNIGNILLGCPALECLSLKSVFMKMVPSPVLVSHSKLKKLSIKNVYYNLSCSIAPNLDTEFLVNAPQLVKLEILGAFFCISFNLVDVLRLLVHVHLDFRLRFHNGLDLFMLDLKQKKNLNNLLEKVRYSKELLLGPRCQQVLDRIKEENNFLP